MINKWLFTKNFAPASLIVLKAAVCNFSHVNLSGKNQNMLVSLISLNLSFYKNPAWAQTISTSGYKPYPEIPSSLQFVIKSGNTEVQKQMKAEATTDYATSISYENGWFGPLFLSAVKIGTIASPTATHQTYTKLDITQTLILELATKFTVHLHMHTHGHHLQKTNSY